MDIYVFFYVQVNLNLIWNFLHIDIIGIMLGFHMGCQVLFTQSHYIPMFYFDALHQNALSTLYDTISKLYDTIRVNYSIYIDCPGPE